MRRIRKLTRGVDRLRVLDIGCGNHSPTITKRWLKNCIYTGADIAEYNLNADDRLAMDEFVIVGADGSGYEQISDGTYDLVLMSHVIEHMRDPLPIVAALCRKLKPGGYIYLAFPSVRSLSLPAASDTALNFCDDPTHIRIADVREIAQTMLDNDMRVIQAGRSKDMPRYLLGAMLYPYALLHRAVTGRMRGRGLWHYLGFEDMVLGQRRVKPVSM